MACEVFVAVDVVALAVAGRRETESQCRVTEPSMNHIVPSLPVEDHCQSQCHVTGPLSGTGH